MTPTQDTSAWIALSLVPGLGDQSLRKLLNEFGLPAQILQASESTLSKVVGDKVAARIKSEDYVDSIAKTLAWLDEPNHAIVTLADAEYPPLLLQTPDPPPLIYVKGRGDLLSRPSIAVVGSRNATAQGISNAENFSRSLSDSGLCIVSGMALGIDAAAHVGGLAGAGKSIAVVGTGLDRIYPARNKNLAHELAQVGALVSEFPLGTPPLANNFPRRNRIISGLSLGCLVVEAAVSSGSLITARLALDQGREVFAIPGSIHSALAKGCHQLIKQGAKLVERAEDILEELHWADQRISATSEPASKADEDPLLLQLGFDPEAIDALVTRTGLSPEQVSGRLLELELEGRVQSLPGGRYQRLVR
jgi:DNA processing protein